MTPYLDPGEYAAYGIPSATASQVNSATRLIDAYLGRPEGLLWSPDADGAPAYMTNAIPSATYTATIPAGSGVVVTIPFARFGNQTIGEVVILDRGNPELTEACVVTAASGDAITLDTVRFDHSAVTVDFGLTILDEFPVRQGTIRASRSPVANVLCGFSRIGFGTRTLTDCGYNPMLLETPGWARMDMTPWDMNFTTGSILVLPYWGGRVVVRMRYVAGWPLANLPGAIKQAAASIVGSLGDDRAGGDIRTLKSGDGTIEWFGSGVMNPDTMSLLQPFRMIRI